MVNSFDDETNSNQNKIFYTNDDRSEGSNIGDNNWSVGTYPTSSRDLNLLCDEIHNIRAPNT